MGSFNRYSRLLVLLLGAGASFYMGAQWLRVPGKPSELVGLTNDHALANRQSGMASAGPQSAVERDPALQIPLREHVVPAPGSGEAFASLSWLPPPPKKMQPAPPPPVAAPTAPPLPFSFVGLLEQGLGADHPKAFLAKGDILLVVSAGEIVENNYSVDSVSDQQITLTYLPLKTKQTLSISGAAR